MRQLLPATSTLKTAWSYLPNSGDRRLSQIADTGLASGQYTTLAFGTTPENQIAAITETSDAAALYPATLTQTASYNNLNELTSLSGQARTYDLNGNLLSDGQRSYAWDAENRLVGITYPGAPGKATAFTYDGLDRRVAIGETPTGGGSATTTGYAWCGSAICQSRSPSGARLRSYYGEGEFVAGTPGQSLFYGLDQVGSVRRVFASASSAPAYAYDPYGVPLGATTPITDFTYAGLLNQPASGLYLAQYRAYDAPAGRWLTRDPIGEIFAKDLADLDYQNRTWLRHHENQTEMSSPVEMVSSIVDDVPLSNFIEDEAKNLSKSELISAKKLLDAIDNLPLEMFQKPAREVIKSPEWRKVIEAAGEFCKVWIAA